MLQYSYPPLRRISRRCRKLHTPIAPNVVIFNFSFQLNQLPRRHSEENLAGVLATQPAPCILTCACDWLCARFASAGRQRRERGGLHVAFALASRGMWHPSYVRVWRITTAMSEGTAFSVLVVAECIGCETNIATPEATSLSTLPGVFEHILPSLSFDFHHIKHFLSADGILVLGTLRVWNRTISEMDTDGCATPDTRQESQQNRRSCCYEKQVIRIFTDCCTAHMSQQNLVSTPRTIVTGSGAPMRDG